MKSHCQHVRYMYLPNFIRCLVQFVFHSQQSLDVTISNNGKLTSHQKASLDWMFTSLIQRGTHLQYQHCHDITEILLKV